MILTPAALRYLGGIYEKCVDRGLHVEHIRLQLAAKGVARSPAMVRHELDSVFCFHGYAASHPAPPALSLADFDRQIGW